MSRPRQGHGLSAREHARSSAGSSTCSPWAQGIPRPAQGAAERPGRLRSGHGRTPSPHLPGLGRKRGGPLGSTVQSECGGSSQLLGSRVWSLDDQQGWAGPKRVWASAPWEQLQKVTHCPGCSVQEPAQPGKQGRLGTGTQWEGCAAGGGLEWGQELQAHSALGETRRLGNHTSLFINSLAPFVPDCSLPPRLAQGPCCPMGRAGPRK